MLCSNLEGNFEPQGSSFTACEFHTAGDFSNQQREISAACYTHTTRTRNIEILIYSIFLATSFYIVYHDVFHICALMVFSYKSFSAFTNSCAVSSSRDSRTENLKKKASIRIFSAGNGQTGHLYAYDMQTTYLSLYNSKTSATLGVVLDFKRTMFLPTYWVYICTVGNRDIPKRANLQ